MMIRFFCMTVLLTLTLVACAEQQRAAKITTTTSGVGDSTALAGTILGAFTGTTIGSGLDKADILYAQRNAQFAFETQKAGQLSSWRNPDSGNSGTLTPSRSFKGSQGEQCRDFQQTVKVKDTQEKAFGSACRDKDGSWRIVKQ